MHCLILQQFMKGRSHTNVMSVIQLLLKKLKKVEKIGYHSNSNFECNTERGSIVGSAIKNLGLFSKSPGDFKMETMDF